MELAFLKILLCNVLEEEEDYATAVALVVDNITPAPINTRKRGCDIMSDSDGT